MTPRRFKYTQFCDGTLDFSLECIRLLQKDLFKQGYITFNATVLGQEEIYPNTHLRRTFFAGYILFWPKISAKRTKFWPKTHPKFIKNTLRGTHKSKFFPEPPLHPPLVLSPARTFGTRSVFRWTTFKYVATGLLVQWSSLGPRID